MTMIIKTVETRNDSKMSMIFPGLWWFIATPVLVISNCLVPWKHGRFRRLITFVCPDRYVTGDLELILYELQKL